MKKGASGMRAFAIARAIAVLMIGWAMASGSALAQITVDGTNSAGEDYVGTANNTNSNAGQPTSTNVETLLVYADSTNLYLFAEGILNNRNRMVFLIDSDGNNTTGFTTHPSGNSSISSALEYFNAFPDGGGYDLTIDFQSGGGSNPNFFEPTVISYDAAGAIVDEKSPGVSAANPDSVSTTMRGNSGTLLGGMVQGNGPNDGVEVGVPRDWLVNSGQGSMRVVCLTANGNPDLFFDASVPQMGTTGDIDPSVPGDEDRLHGLVAPEWNWENWFHTLYFAHFGNGQGFTSDTVLTSSSSTSPATGRVDYSDNDGNPLPVGIAGAEHGIAALATASSVNFSIPHLDP